MKINTFKKVAVSTMALAMGAALVGSISGSIAWYQYSTRSTVAYSGASAHCTESLQVRLPAVAARAGTALNDGDTGEDGVKYYTRAADASGAGALNDGTYAYTLVGTGNAVVADADDTYFPLESEGADASDWSSDLRFKDVQNYIKAVRGVADYDLRPVTTGALAADEVKTSFFKSPIYQYENTATWGAADMFDYVELPLAFRVLDVDGVGNTFLDKEVYLTKLTIADLGGNQNITNAIRVGVDGTTDATYSTTGVDTNVYGNLDLNNDNVLDTKEVYDANIRYTVANITERDALTGMVNSELCQVKEDHKVYKYVAASTEWVEATETYCVYGDADEVAESVVATATASDADPYNITGDALVSTGTSENGAAVTVRIYLEGWQLLEGSAIWDAADYVGSSFSVTMRFSVEAHERH